MAAEMAVHELIQTIKRCMDEKGPSCDLNHLDISKFVSLDNLFSYELAQFNGDISRWDTSNVTSMNAMFKTSSFNGDISRWDVSKVTSMHEMFASSSFTGDISAWDVSRVQSMSEMFLRTQYRGDLSNWDVSNVRNMQEMFAQSGYRGDLSRWDVSRVTNMEKMLSWCRVGDISKWDVSNVLNFSCLFKFGSCDSNLGAWRIHPDARVDSMMGQCQFQGSFPRVPLHPDGAYPLTELYFGDIADTYTLDEAKELVYNQKWLDLYLKTTAPKGLRPLHMAKAATLKTKPNWMPAPAFKWAKQQHAVCLGLGMDARESARWMADAYSAHLRGETVAPNAVEFDFTPAQ